MTERTLRVLEFTKIRDRLAEFALTDGGREQCRTLTPMTELSAVTAAQNETEEGVVVITYVGGHPMIGFPDVSESLSLAQKGSTLSQKALLNVAETLRAARAARSALVTDRENTPLITQRASRLQTFRSLETDITDAILSEDEIADRASPALMDIRRHIRQASDRVRERLSQMAHGAQFSKYLQEAIVTVRNGRYVLPVKAEFRANVPGLVHDQSSTGATLFVEPLAVVELSNEVREWTVKEHDEIERILAALSALVGENSDLIAQNIAIMTHLDFVFAKAMLSRDMEAVAPKINTEGRLRFVRVRHPLIDREKVVPCDLWLGDDFTTLVITGPNTGGKTVTLKTVGLLSLMAQAGLQVPGALGTEVAVFDNVYADIGDEQSIEQSLSTFSSHMTNIVSIMRSVKPNDLVLFDELGAGTDPTEGAALAQAILTALLQMQVRTVATTHYSELKAFALTTRGVENASVEFDVSTLRPTYRLSIGVPGKSNAFEISARLGLDASFIESAKSLLSHETVRFEDVIANAEYHKQVAEKERVLAEQARQETVRLRDEAERLYKEMAEKERGATRKAKEDARRILENARRESDAIISDLKRLKKAQSAPDHEAAALKKRLEDGIDSLSEGLLTPIETHQAPPKNVKPGDLVDILNLGTKGTVLARPDEKGEVSVQAGIMKMKVHLTQLRLVKEQKPAAKKSSVVVKTGTADRQTALSCDVRGHALDEALPVIDEYLDEAVMSGFHEVTIVHGKGTGVLRAGIQQHLKRHMHVKSFRLGVYGEGEDGVTVVTLK